MKDKLISTPWGKAVKILTFDSRTGKTKKHVSKKRYKELVAQIESIIQRARDSTLMDAEYDARVIEQRFSCNPIEIELPENDWLENDHRGVNHDRWFVVSLYIDKTKGFLVRQGFIISL